MKKDWLRQPSQPQEGAGLEEEEEEGGRRATARVPAAATGKRKYKRSGDGKISNLPVLF